MSKWVKAEIAKFRALRHFTVMQQEKTTITPYDDLTIEDALWTEFEVSAAEYVQASSITQEVWSLSQISESGFSLNSAEKWFIRSNRYKPQLV